MSEATECSANFITLFCAVGYRKWHVFTLLAWRSARFEHDFDRLGYAYPLHASVMLLDSCKLQDRTGETGLWGQVIFGGKLDVRG